MFLMARYPSLFQIISQNWKHLINGKTQAEILLLTRDIKQLFVQRFMYVFHQNWKQLFFQNIFWNRKHVINQARKKVFCHLIVKNYLCNVLCKLLIKIERTWRREIKEQAPTLTLLYCGRTPRRRRWSALWKKMFLKISQYHKNHLC